MANEAPARPKTIRSHILLIIIGAAVSVAYASFKLYPYIMILYPYVVKANVQWTPFILVMIGTAALGAIYLGVMHYIRQNHRN